jgi:hypothetical protein
MEKQVPDFAIFQNSRTMQSAIWTKEHGEWIQCRTSEYAPLAVIVNLLRHSPNPQAVMEELQKVARKIKEEEL